MTVEPLGARVLVRPLEQETTTSGGLIVPDIAKEKPQKGIVEAIGTADAMTTSLQIGDQVLFAKYAGSEIRVNGSDLLLLEETDVLARLRN